MTHPCRTAIAEGGMATLAWPWGIPGRMATRRQVAMFTRRRRATRRATVLALAAALLAGLLTASVPASAAPAPAAEEPTIVVIFPFASADGGVAGRKFADRLRLRAKRLGLVIVDPLSLRDAMTDAQMPTLQTTPAQMAAILTGRLAARVGLWGTVEPAGQGLVMHYRGLNLDLGADRLTLQETRRADQPQLINPVQDEVLLKLTGRRKKPVAEATPEADAKVPTVGPELVPNGGFEQGAKTPTGWDRVDGLTTFWTVGGASGKCLKVNTDVYHDEWVAWRKKHADGAGAGDAPKPTPTSGAKYDTVAGIYGVKYDSRPIPVTPGKAYKISIQYKGRSTDFFFPKLFIRGWAQVAGEKRVVYNAYLALRCIEGPGEWKRGVRICEIPTDTQAPIEYLVLKIYAYWPPGTYYFDNVSMKQVAPGTKIPGPDRKVGGRYEKRRCPSPDRKVGDRVRCLAFSLARLAPPLERTPDLTVGARERLPFSVDLRSTAKQARNVAG